MSIVTAVAVIYDVYDRMETQTILKFPLRSSQERIYWTLLKGSDTSHHFTQLETVNFNLTAVTQASFTKGRFTERRKAKVCFVKKWKFLTYTDKSFVRCETYRITFSNKLYCMYPLQILVDGAYVGRNKQSESRIHHNYLRYHFAPNRLHRH